MRKFIFTLLLLLVIGSPAAVLAAESNGGIIEGNVVNKTQDGSAVSGLEVTLKTYTKNDELSSAVAKTDSKGHFVFTGVLIDSSYSYILMLPFQQVIYYSQDFAFDEVIRNHLANLEEDIFRFLSTESSNNFIMHLVCI